MNKVISYLKEIRQERMNKINLNDNYEKGVPIKVTDNDIKLFTGLVLGIEIQIIDKITRDIKNLNK